MQASSFKSRWIVLWLLLLAAVGALSWPAMTGTWVYDDITMVGHPALDSLEDLTQVWGRTSSDYLTPGDEGLESGYTWRPLTMATLVGVHAASGGSAFAHHVMSWLLHAAVLAALVLTGVRSRGSLDLVGGGAIILFALHPAGGEAWLWINGRSDLVCAVGVALAGLAVSPRHDGCPHGRWTAVAFATAGLVGALGKEVALPALAAVALASALPARVEPADLVRAPRRAAGLVRASVRRAVPLVVGLVAVVAVWRMGRLAAADETGSFAGISIDAVITRSPLALAIAGETLVAPVPRPMRMMAWEFFVGWTPSRATVFIVMVAILVGTLWRGRLRSTVLLLGAAATLAPVTLVADFDWLGFDRYLYVPMVLAVLAVLWDGPRCERAPARWVVGCGVLIALMGAALVGQAAVYRSHATWVESMIVLQPENPSSHVKYAHWQLNRGEVNAAAALIEALVDTPMPSAIRHGAAGVALHTGRPDLAASHVEAAWRDAPHDPTVQFDVLGLRAAQHRWDDVARVAVPLLATGLTCGRTVRALDEWLTADAVSAPHDDTLTALVTAAECP